MKKHPYIVFSIILVISLGAIIFSFHKLYHDCKAGNEKTYHFDVTKNKKSDFNYTMSNSGSWHDGVNFGLSYAQYDFNLYNNSKKNLSDWKIVLKFDSKIKIDSSWNGEYELLDDSTLKITPLDYNQFIQAGAQMPFGCVIAAKGIVGVDSFVLEAHYNTNWRQTRKYFVLKFIAEAWIVLLLIYILIILRASSHKRRQAREEQIILHAINTLVDFIEAKDDSTKGHSKRVAVFTRRIAKRMKLPPEDIRNFYFTALVHDCGKIGIPDNILKKEDKLTPEEYNVIKSHTTIGAGMLTSFTDIKNITDGPLQHHERYDGKGYPNGLKGEEISLSARIIAVADTFDVMNSERCYKKKYSKEQIINELKDNSGTQFDPKIVDIFLQMLEDGSITFD